MSETIDERVPGVLDERLLAEEGPLDLAEDDAAVDALVRGEAVGR